MTENNTQAAECLSRLTAELDTIKELSNDVWTSLTWFGRLTLFVPIMFLSIYLIFTMRFFFALESVKIPRLGMLLKKLAKLFFREKSV